ncbi:family 20 glycosylhydrolase [Streptomyces sp. NPDC088400]|uniref:family 20 glycosylhydrolase n=1 Tax=Streptomyces sp. NPDC088400 TaxID=3365861 RepID=UPI00382BFFF4
MVRRRRFAALRDTRTSRLTGVLVAALLLVTGLAPTAPAAPTAPGPDGGAPSTLPALTNWTAEKGSFTFTRRTRLVVDPHDPGARRAASTLAQDLRAAGRGTVPTAHGTAHPGDIVIATAPRRSKELGREGYELRVGDRVRITGGTGTGAFYGTRTLLQLLDTAGDTGDRDRIPSGRTVDIPAYRERGVGVCACYIHVTPQWLENLVRDMSYLKLNQLLLELKVKSDRHPEANSWGYYTKDEIRRLVALGARYHVTIIPEINSPGHMDPWLEHRPDLQLTDSDGKPQPSRLDITSPSAFSYYTSLMDEYAEVFTASDWHMGADEYMLGSDFAKYPHILEYARRTYGPDATPQDAFIDFVNRVHDYATSKGKRLRIWNDGLTGDNTIPVRAGTTVEHWLGVTTKPTDILAQGHPLMNASYSLYLVRGGFHMNTESLYEQRWDPRSFEGEKVPASTSATSTTGATGITGAKISLWPDNGRGETENEVDAAMFLPLRFIAQTTWGVPHPDPTYAAFAARAELAGHAPGRHDLTRVPVPDGTYTLRDAEGQLPARDWRITRTSDGYATLRNTSTGRCAEIRGGRLTLNTPLEPGTPVTEETCSAANTLQRWQLTRVRGGYHLTNAITRMTVHVVEDGRLVQYPPDQRPPAVWTLTSQPAGTTH